MKGAVSHQKFLIDQLRKNEGFREAYLNEALNENERGVSLGMFRNVAEAMGGITKLAKFSGLNRQNLYRALSGERDPAFSTVEGIVHGLGFRIKVEPAKNPVIYTEDPEAAKAIGFAKEKPSRYAVSQLKKTKLSKNKKGH